ncbi:uncharacterized protein An11g08040 [Aspergillus niger]|uniref:Contig An11c0270, genomic contig n=2 Tax=Aspergillus niger TaxID=5061 RepID=A2QX89_ASPNC|nr:uncharacterized protein An11g08040 [Aspergillus niger]CAK45997.1 unnamed protein product [Aspergillus niger]
MGFNQGPGQPEETQAKIHGQPQHGEDYVGVSLVAALVGVGANAAFRLDCWRVCGCPMTPRPRKPMRMCRWWVGQLYARLRTVKEGREQGAEFQDVILNGSEYSSFNGEGLVVCTECLAYTMGIQQKVTD